MIGIGFDIGSSFIKAALVDVKSKRTIAIVRVPDKEMSIEAQNPGWAEQDPNLWWKHLCQATQKLLAKAQIKAEKISSIGISYQMHGLVLVDQDLKPLRKSIIWCDSRATSYGDKAFRVLGKKYCRDHLLNSPGNFTAAKLAWVIDNEPKLYQKAHKLMLPGDFLAAKLSGIPQTTITGLSEGIFWDFKNNQSSKTLFDYYQIDHNLVPEIVENFTVQANVSKAGAEATGLKRGTPITYRAGDQPNNAYTLGARNNGDVVATGGRLRRAAFDLASDEMHEGIWAIEDAAEPQVLRYAADDRDEQTATYSSDGYTVTVRSESQAWTATLDHGTPGASLKIDNEWVTLELGSAVDLPVDALPEALTLIDLTGREISLGRT